jgi:hypothetical protein
VTFDDDQRSVISSIMLHPEITPADKYTALANKFTA